jgi:hypothetical protein
MIYRALKEGEIIEKGDCEPDIDNIMVEIDECWIGKKQHKGMKETFRSIKPPTFEDVKKTSNCNCAFCPERVLCFNKKTSCYEICKATLKLMKIEVEG